jgi:hypothetical protein
MRAIYLIGFMALGGCSTVGTVLTPQVTPSQAYVLANSFDVIEASATVYQKLPSCAATTVSVCKKPEVSAKVKALILAGRKIRDNLESAAVDANGQPISSGLFNDLATNIDSIKMLIQEVLK